MKKMLILVGFVCLLPSLYLAVNSVIDPYYCTTLAVADESNREGFISPVTFSEFTYDPEDSGHQGYYAILVGICQVCGFSSLETAFLPIGGALVPFLFFALTRKLFKSDSLAACFALFISYDPSLLPGHYSVFAYAWERILLLLFLICVISLYEGRKRGSFLFVIIIAFVGVFSVYWTTPVLMILFLATIQLSRIGKTLTADGSFPNRNIVGILGVVALLVVYLSFSRILYDEFLPAILYERYGTLGDAADELLAWTIFGGQQSEAVRYSYQLASNWILNVVLVSRYIVIMSPIVAYIAIRFLRSGRVIRSKSGPKDMVFLPAFVTCAAQTTGYALRGHFSLRYALILFPLLSVISMEKIGQARIRALPIALLAILAVFSFTNSVLSDEDMYIGYTSLDSSSAFLFENGDEDSWTVMDLNTYGVYLVQGVATNNSLNVMFYTSEVFGYVIGEDESLRLDGRQLRYVVINSDLLKHPTAAPNWTRFEPLAWHLSDISENYVMSAVYDDGEASILYSV